MSNQIAIISLFHVTTDYSPSALAEEVQDLLSENGLPIISSHAWGDTESQLQGLGAAASSFIGTPPAAPTSVTVPPTL